MCVIIHVPKGTKIDQSTLKDCYDTNQHGWGIMSVVNGVLSYCKDITPFDDFLKQWNAVPDTVDRVVHFRIRTDGSISKDMSHPFLIKTNTSNYLMMHNGMFGIPSFDKDKSDTWHYAKLLEGMYRDSSEFVYDTGIQEQVNKSIGGSKLAFMNKDGAVVLFGHFSDHEGCKFSNLTWKSRKNLYTYGGNTGTQYGNYNQYRGYHQNYQSYGEKEMDRDLNSRNDSLKSGSKSGTESSASSSSPALFRDLKPKTYPELIEDVLDEYLQNNIGKCILLIKKNKINLEDIELQDPGFISHFCSSVLEGYTFPEEKPKK